MTKLPAVLMTISFVLFTLGAAAQSIILTPDEIEQTLTHGPWPDAIKTDASNRVSGLPEAIAFGQKLFVNPELSKDGQFTCATCHQPANDFADGLPRAMGQQQLDRNTPALSNLSFNRWYGWDGRSDNLWAQSMLPILHADEMAMTPDAIKTLMQRPALHSEYSTIFGDPKDQSPVQVTVSIGKALAAYQETLTTGQTAFDRFRDALSANDMKAAATYPIAAQRGLSMFLGRGNCSFCHSGALFSNGEFHDAGVPYFIDSSRVDTGRHGGLKILRDSPFTLDGDHTDDQHKTGAWAVRQVMPQHSDFGLFRVPGLRNVAKTAPYMHNGSLATLDDVIRHYSEIDLERLHADGEAILVPLNLNPTEISDLVAFLETLSSP